MNCLRENKEKIQNRFISNTKNLKESVKEEKNSRRNHILQIKIYWFNFVDNLAEGIHTIKSKYGHNDKKCENVKLNTRIVCVVLNTQMLKII